MEVSENRDERWAAPWRKKHRYTFFPLCAALLQKDSGQSTTSIYFLGFAINSWPNSKPNSLLSIFNSNWRKEKNKSKRKTAFTVTALGEVRGLNVLIVALIVTLLLPCVIVLGTWSCI